jgi:DNA-directed RNA polymerase subunit RPC12/RpoP
MALVTCPECGTEVSDQAKACPKCGAPVGKKKIDRMGAWCPNCGNRRSEKDREVTCFYAVLVVCTLGGALLLYPLLPQRWRCLECEHKWKA